MVGALRLFELCKLIEKAGDSNDVAHCQMQCLSLGSAFFEAKVAILAHIEDLCSKISRRLLGIDSKCGIQLSV